MRPLTLSGCGAIGSPAARPVSDLDRVVDMAHRVDREAPGRHGVRSTSSRSISCATLACGTITPCVPSSPRAAQMSKKPSIFSLTPPIGCTSPNWLTEPVTARHCLTGTSAIDDSSASSSASEALSPSTMP